MFIIYQLELLFFIITTFLYIFILICVYQEWRSKDTIINISFFKLFFVTGVIDLLTLIGNNLLNVMPKACLFPEFYNFISTPFLHIYFFICWGCGTNQGFCVIVIALNRLTTIVYPNSNSKYWNSKKWIYLAFGFQIFPGFISGGFTLTSGVYWKIELDDCALIPSFINKPLPRLYFTIAGFYQFLISAILIIIYSIIVFTIKNAHKSQNNFIQTISNQNQTYHQRQYQRELRLLLMSNIICGSQVFLSIYIIFREITKIDKDFVGVSFITDICAGVNPYLMLFFCKAIRTRMLRMIGFSNKIIVRNVKITSNLKSLSS